MASIVTFNRAKNRWNVTLRNSVPAKTIAVKQKNLIEQGTQVTLTGLKNPKYTRYNDQNATANKLVMGKDNKWRWEVTLTRDSGKKLSMLPENLYVSKPPNQQDKKTPLANANGSISAQQQKKNVITTLLTDAGWKVRFDAWKKCARHTPYNKGDMNFFKILLIDMNTSFTGTCIKSLIPNLVDLTTFSDNDPDSVFINAYRKISLALHPDRTSKLPLSVSKRTTQVSGQLNSARPANCKP